MNLRDLIYSQSSDVAYSQSLSQNETPKAPTTQPRSQLCQDAAELHIQNEAEPDKKRRRTSFKSAQSTKKLPVYGDNPLVEQQISVERDRKIGARMPRYAPGLNGYAHFEQNNLPVCAHQRDVIRKLWLKCFHGKDFEGAAMALSVLSEIDPITPSDISVAADMLRYSNNAEDSIKRLVQGVLKRHPRDIDRRHASMAVSVELSLAAGDLKTARKLLQENMIEFTTSNSQELKAYDTLVIVSAVVNLAREICHLLHAPLQTPTIETITNDPLEFNKCIKVIHMARTATSFANHKLKAKRQECNRVLQDLKASFNLTVTGTTAPSEHDRMDLEALYIAYMYGVGHETKAMRYLTNLKKTIQSADCSEAAKLETLSKYYKLLATYLSRYRYSSPNETIVELRSEISGSSANVSSSSSSSSSIGNTSYSKIVKALVHQVESDTNSNAAPTMLNLYRLFTLYRIGGLSDEVYLDRICAMMEVAQPAAAELMNADLGASSNSLVYLLWRELARVLGELDSKIWENDPIRGDSELARFLPGLVDPISESPASSLAAPASAFIEESAATNVLKQRHWWRTSLLSPNQWDGFPIESSTDIDQVSAILRDIADYPNVTSHLTNHSQRDEEGQLPDLYAAWKSREVEFGVDLAAAFTTRHRKMSEDIEDEQSSDDGEGNEEGKGEDAGAAEDAFVANTSHDDTDYHSNESGEEYPSATGPGDQPSSAGALNTTGYLLNHNLLSMAVHYRELTSELSSESIDNIVWRTLLGVSSQVSRTSRSGFSVQKVTLSAPVSDKYAPNSLIARHNRPTTQYVMGNKLLEIMTWQALVSAHLFSQDNFLTIRATQLLLQHIIRDKSVTNDDALAQGMGSTAVAEECLRLLLRNQVNVIRAAKIGIFLTSDGADLSLPATQCYKINDCPVRLSGMQESAYRPVVR